MRLARALGLVRSLRVRAQPGDARPDLVEGGLGRGVLAIAAPERERRLLAGMRCGLDLRALQPRAVGQSQRREVGAGLDLLLMALQVVDEREPFAQAERVGHAAGVRIRLGGREPAQRQRGCQQDRQPERAWPHGD